ncbi:MAG: hypothetical protein GYB67_18200 [Chloroflexi bacterium]|nr:hypothetical protein [Chloroflexota bacterium]
MTLALRQFGGIIRYEALMQYRRRIALVVPLFFIVALLALSGISQLPADGQNARQAVRVERDGDGAVLTSRDLQTGALVEERFTPEQASAFPDWLFGTDLEMVTATIQPMLVIGVSVSALFIALMPLLAETVALDGQYKTREVLNALPLGQGTYLAGKVFSVWLTLIIGLGLAGVIYAFIARAMYGPYDLGLYIRMWASLVYPGTLIAAGISVVAAAGTQRRRSAVIVGIMLIPLAFIMYAVTLSLLFASNVLSLMTTANIQTNLTYVQVLSSVLADIVAAMSYFAVPLAALWFVMWLWLRSRAYR